MAGHRFGQHRKLSGGQQQRVAVARVLFFDEPLSNLDAKPRAGMWVELRELRRRLDITSLYVKHDQEEALAISDRVILMNGGRIERNRFVADFVGSANLISGKVRGQGADGTLIFAADGGVELEVVASQASRERDTVAVRSSYIHYPSRPYAGLAQRGSGTYPPPHVPRRLHPVRGGLAARSADRAPASDRGVRGRQRRDGVICSRALRAAVARHCHCEKRSDEAIP
jgi:ABC-type Fe3+/spermidine/putrescine transport system ATPase subunit